MRTKKYKYLLYLSSLLIILSSIAACSSSTDPYKAYIGKGEQVYPSKSDSIAAYPGKYKVILKISNPTDPHVKKAGIFWRNGTDSLIVNYPPNSDTLSVEIDSLKTEGTYSFNIFNYDERNNKSVGQTVTTNIYGDIYISQLVDRSISESVFNLDNTITKIKWNNNTVEGMVGTLVKYTTTNNKVSSIYIPVDSSITRLSNFKIGSNFKYKTFYKPSPNSFDSLSTKFTTTTLNKIILIPTSQEEGQIWKYTKSISNFNTNKAWTKISYDDSNWDTGLGGFGSFIHFKVPTARTEWESSDIFLRKTITIPDPSSLNLEKLTINMHHDDKGTVYINGVQAVSDGGYGPYKKFSVSDAAKNALKEGKNTIAVHCHQNTGGQYIDLGLYTSK